MEISISEQLLSCLAHLVLGVFSATLYDVFCVLRLSFLGRVRLAKSGRYMAWFADFILDLIFCVVLSLCFSVITFAYSYGKFRTFNLLGFGVGFALYRLTFSRIFMLFANKLINIVKFVLLFALKILLFPLKSVLKLLIKILFNFIFSPILIYFKKRRLAKYYKSALERIESDITFA